AGSRAGALRRLVADLSHRGARRRDHATPGSRHRDSPRHRGFAPALSLARVRRLVTGRRLVGVLRHFYLAWAQLRADAADDVGDRASGVSHRRGRRVDGQTPVTRLARLDRRNVDCAEIAEAALRRDRCPSRRSAKAGYFVMANLITITPVFW